MDAPSPQEEPEAYVPAAAGADVWWPPASRAAAIEQARRARLDEGGLPVDGPTLERVADAVLDPSYELPGLFYTPEEAADEVPDEVLAAVDDYFRRHPGIAGGQRIGWRDGRATLFVGIVGDSSAHADAVAKLSAGRATVESRIRTEGELEALATRIVDDEAELQQAGFEPLVISADPSEGVVEVEMVGGADEAAAREFVASRYGPAVRIEWLGPSVLREAPHPFGSWTSESLQIRVFFGLDHNGEQFKSAVIDETPDRILVSLTKLEPVGPATLVGGYQPQHADLDLIQPIGDRDVIDASSGHARPSLAQLRAS